MNTMLSLFFLLLFSTQSNANFTDECLQKCGTIEIPYPFGIGKDCYLSKHFEISCQQTPTPIPYIAGTDHQVLDISNGKVRTNSTPFIATECPHSGKSPITISLPEDGPFTLSSTSNVFTGVGCLTVAALADKQNFTSSCMTVCTGSENSVEKGSCTGVGCCESGIPRTGKFLQFGARHMFDVPTLDSDCAYAFIVERGEFVFMESYLNGLQLPNMTMALDWSIGNLSCSDTESSVCGDNSICVNFDSTKGYLCKCQEGYAGNAYMNGPKGCKDIDECTELDHSPCVHDNRCVNTNSSYRCSCPFGSIGDGKLHGTGCKVFYQHAEHILAAGLITIGLLLCGWLLHSAVKKYKLIKLREEYFRKNGGLILKQQISTQEGGNGCARIISLEELKHATKNYCQSRIIGTGGSGTVYKGVLKDGSVVAVKISKLLDNFQISQFINEFLILTQINHRNIVKLLGCCLETEVPILIYEFVTNGTLHGHLHERISGRRLSWANRLRIAVETAEALSYLHSAASTPIFHRDVKSSNILLDDNYTAKVADFGLSKLVPLDQSQVSTRVQGTLGYLDPEYFVTCQLTDKSDAYSFGVLLLELLTGQKPISLDRPPKSSSLPMYFFSEMKNKDLSHIVDKNILREGSIDELMAVSEVAWKCLLSKGDERPTMKEVALELSGIASSGRKTLVDEQLPLPLFEDEDKDQDPSQ